MFPEFSMQSACLWVGRVGAVEILQERALYSLTRFDLRLAELILNDQVRVAAALWVPI